ncbi:uncharacterized protein [Chelonus insularis]|uniref:uncharacterized protein n=1 Tax=Chelonus insularis TaxID=460826 RepID=UPI00158A1801|nr:uncharacterized protein LOC118074507 [Chelonus insularis]
MVLEDSRVKMIRLKYLNIILFSVFIISTYGKSESDEVKIEKKCLDDSIEFQLLQNEPFSGSIYIKGHEKENTCRKTYRDIKNPTLSVLHQPCAPKTDNIVDVIAVIKPLNGTKIVRNIKCDYNENEVEAKAEIRILSSTTPTPSTPAPITASIEDIKHNLHQNVMQLWKTINNVLCDCNLKTYVNKIKSFVKPSE